MNCKGCGAEIVFMTTVSGKIVPLNLPSKRFVMTDTIGRVKLVDTWESHFVTCPEAKEFRK